MGTSDNASLYPHNSFFTVEINSPDPFLSIPQATTFPNCQSHGSLTSPGQTETGHSFRRLAWAAHAAASPSSRGHVSIFCSNHSLLRGAARARRQQWQGPLCRRVRVHSHPGSLLRLGPQDSRGRGKSYQKGRGAPTGASPCFGFGPCVSCCPSGSQSAS